MGIGHHQTSPPRSRRRVFRRARLGLWTTLVLVACTPPTDTPRGLTGRAAGWSVVLLSIDTLRADRLGAYGYELRATSPAIDALHHSGVRFDKAMAPRALTWPSLASVLSGLYPSRHGVLSNGYNLPDELATLPKLLGGAGYQTGAFLSNMCRANHQGWDGFSCGGGVDTKVTRRALEWIEDSDPQRPFLLWVHLFGPHPPYYNGGERARTTLDPGYSGPLAPKKRALNRIMQEGIELTPPDLYHLDALYDAAVMGTDHLVSGFLDGLRESRGLEKTLLVFLSDHGEELYQHNGYLYHACSVYQTTLHVPLAFVAPGLIAPGGAVAQTVELIDVLPTLLDLLAVPQPPELNGDSLVPYLERPQRRGPGKPAFSEYDQTRIRTVLSGDWKLIDNPDGITPYCLPDGPQDLYPIAETELYNLAHDPHETNNLAKLQADKVAELRQLLLRHFTALGKRGESQEIPEDLKRELEALGYVAQ